ncbi:hypothetical protein [Prescottella sp. R16]|uniref:hypothetical protein n=1 Tax=Prescottella sp. R16 TaxID=3064529 RepID=UPI00272E318C|nr:hypothetical protein [Prescottella sp. R16]
MTQNGSTGRTYRRGLTRAGTGPRSGRLWAACTPLPVAGGSPHPVPGGERGDDADD